LEKGTNLIRQGRGEACGFYPLRIYRKRKRIYRRRLCIPWKKKEDDEKKKEKEEECSWSLSGREGLNSLEGKHQVGWEQRL